VRVSRLSVKRNGCGLQSRVCEQLSRPAKGKKKSDEELGTNWAGGPWGFDT